MQAFAFVLEIGPLVTGLLVAGRAAFGIGAVLFNMWATQQIDGIESLPIDFTMKSPPPSCRLG